MEKRTALAGTLLRAERLRRRKGQKEICCGICVPSYLSKIERGSVCPDEKILSALFERLGIRYEDDPDVLRNYGEKLREYFYRLEYQLDRSALYEELKGAEKTLRYSRHAIDWMLACAFEEETGTAQLAELTDQMDAVQLGWYHLLRYEEKPASKEGYEACRRACELLGNSCALIYFCSACIMQGDYASIHRMESRVVAVAVEEGNTYSLASYFMMKGTAYACLNMEGLMTDCYERGLKILQNTAWKDELYLAYYNIGATYINLKKYDPAVQWLDRALEGYQGKLEQIEKEEKAEEKKGKSKQAEEKLRAEIDGALHKKALALARSGRREEAREILLGVKERLLRNPSCPEADYMKCEEALMECREDFLDRPEYAALLERLIAVLKRDCHFGHLYFYRDVFVESCRRQRRYKKAMEFEREISAKIAAEGL